MGLVGLRSYSSVGRSGLAGLEISQFGKFSPIVYFGVFRGRGMLGVLRGASVT